MKKFFKQLVDYYSNGVIWGKKILCVKFYCQATSFSFDIYCFDVGEIQAFVDDTKIVFRSEVYYGEITESWLRKEILVDIQKALNSIE